MFPLFGWIETMAIAFLLLIVLGGVGLAVFILRMVRRGADAQAQRENLARSVENLTQQMQQGQLHTANFLRQEFVRMESQLGDKFKSVGQNLEVSSTQMQTRLSETATWVQNVSEQLGALKEVTQSLSFATQSLAKLEDVLKPPTVRGRMGETLLENLLREILPSQEFYALQHRFRSAETVDAVIRLKEGLIPIDAKFPLESFRKILESTDPKDTETARKEFVRTIKKHIDDIAKKYILPDEGTLDFALMYIPAENVYYECIVRTDSGEVNADDLYGYSTKKHVFPVSPNSFYPYLMTLALGLRGLTIEKNAKELFRKLARLETDFGKLSNDFRIGMDHLSNADRKFQDANRRLERLGDRILEIQNAAPELPLEGGEN